MDCGRTFGATLAWGAYYFHLVQVQHKQTMAMNDDETEPLPDEQGTNNDCEKRRHKKFKVNDFVDVYYHLLDDRWPNFFA